MKNNNLLPKLTMIIAMALLLQGCMEELPTRYEFSGYSFSGVDATAGQWKLLLHTSPEQVLLPAPAAAGSDALTRELAAAKGKIANASADQKLAVAYWTNNPLLRWNEIALELATKYNLIPAPNADGSYSSPDPANPAK